MTLALLLCSMPYFLLLQPGGLRWVEGAD